MDARCVEIGLVPELETEQVVAKDGLARFGDLQTQVARVIERNAWTYGEPVSSDIAQEHREEPVEADMNQRT